MNRSASGVYVTAAFGPRYHRFAEGFCRSFAAWMPRDRLVLFTDDRVNRYPENVDVRYATDGDLVDSLPEFYRTGRRTNARKFRMLELIGREPGVRQVTWSDVDALVLGNLSEAIVPGLFNFCPHGRRQEAVSIGTGLVVPADEYAVGGLFSLPARPHVWESVQRCLEERAADAGEEPGQRSLGDQPIVNRLRLRYLAQSRWLGGPGLYISMDVGHWRYPRAGDPGVRQFRRTGDGRIVRPDHRRLPYLVAIAVCWDDWLATGFADWDPQVAEQLRSYYPSMTARMQRAARRARWVVPLMWRARVMRAFGRRVVGALMLMARLRWKPRRFRTKTRSR